MRGFYEASGHDHSFIIGCWYWRLYGVSDMRVKKVNRYYCDFCKKAGLQKHAMEKHEKHCTMNPDRLCRMCVFTAGHNQPAPMKELLDLLPDYPEWTHSEERQYQEFMRSAESALPKLRERVDNCPACIMATLRQKNIPVPAIEDFNFKEECQKLFAEVNEERQYEAAYY